MGGGQGGLGGRQLLAQYVRRPAAMGAASQRIDANMESSCTPSGYAGGCTPAPGISGNPPRSALPGKVGSLRRMSLVNMSGALESVSACSGRRGSRSRPEMWSIPLGVVYVAGQVIYWRSVDGAGALGGQRLSCGVNERPATSRQ